MYYKEHQTFFFPFCFYLKYINYLYLHELDQKNLIFTKEKKSSTKNMNDVREATYYYNYFIYIIRIFFFIQT